MVKKILVTFASVVMVVMGVAAFSAFESHVINVTAHIENALRVHPKAPMLYGTVFPQEYFKNFGFGVGTSDSFSAPGQSRVLNIDYIIQQKPKPKPDYVQQAGFDAASEWCRTNQPANANDPNDPYYAKCYPSICPYISKTPFTVIPGDPKPDKGVPSFHNPATEWAIGHLHKTVSISDPYPNNTDDAWGLDFSVPCFNGQCAEDWTHAGYELPAGLEGQMFGCDLWVEVVSIY